MKTRIRSSSLGKLYQCAGHRIMEDLPSALPPNEGGKAAQAGTWCHWRASRTLIDDYGATGPEQGIGPEPDYQPNGHDEWKVDYYLAEITDRLDIDQAILVEESLSYESSDYILTGHADCIVMTITDGDVTAIRGYDLKTGTVVVPEAQDNDQLLGYMLLAQRLWPTITEQTWTIVQPTNDETLGFQRVSSVTLAGEELAQTVDAAESRISHQLKSNIIDSDGDACKYCRACIICPALHQDIQTMQIQLTPDEIARLQAQDSIEAMAKIEQQRSKITNVLKTIQETLRDRILAEGGAMETQNFRIHVTTRNGRRFVTDAKKFWTDMTNEGLDDDDLFEAISFSFTTIEDKAAKKLKLPKTSKDENKRTTKKFLAENLEGNCTQSTSNIITIKNK